MKQDKKCLICDAVPENTQVPDVLQDGRWAEDLAGAYYPKAIWDRMDGEWYCPRCATEIDKAKMLQGLHGRLTYTKGENGEPLEICNQATTMYWEVRYLTDGKYPGYWHAEFIHGTQVWRAVCRDGRAVAEKKYDIPASALIAGGHTPGASPRMVAGADWDVNDFEIDPPVTWVRSPNKGLK